MGERGGGGSGPKDQAVEPDEVRAKAALGEHGPLLARVAMALLGDQGAVEKVLESVAREASSLGDAEDARIALLGRVRAACAAHLARTPLRSRTTGHGTTPAREPEPALARKALARLEPTKREALVLHLVGGLDARGVALAAGLTEEVARARIASAFAQLIEEGR